MDFKKSTTASNLRDATSKIWLYDKKTGEIAEHEGEKMFITVLSEHSPEYKAALNRQVNAEAKQGDKDWDINDEYIKTARLRTAVTAECHINFGGWISKTKESSKEEREKIDKLLREFYREFPEIMDMVKRRSSNDTDFLPKNVGDSLIEHDNSPG